MLPSGGNSMLRSRGGGGRSMLWSRGGGGEKRHDQITLLKEIEVRLDPTSHIKRGPPDLHLSYTNLSNRILVENSLLKVKEVGPKATSPRKVVRPKATSQRKNFGPKLTSRTPRSRISIIKIKLINIDISHSFPLLTLREVDSETTSRTPRSGLKLHFSKKRCGSETHFSKEEKWINQCNVM